MQAELIVDARNAVGESPVWVPEESALYWVDIPAGGLQRWSADTGQVDTWKTPEMLACIARHADGGWVAGMESGFFRLHPRNDGSLDSEPLAHVDHARADMRLNDGRCDRQGRFLFGTKDEGSPLQAIGGFYRLNHDLSLERLPLPAPAISNSIAFSPDGSTMYFCDSPTREIRACDYRADGGVANDRLFVRLADATGEPDGSTVDRDGGLWNAQWGGRRVVRYGADGVETERVEVPTAQPSCVALGGAQLGTLYITSARVGLDAAALAGDLRAGGVFIATPARRGLPEPVFQGAPA